MTQILAQLQVEKVETENGYTIFKEAEVLIPKTYNYSLHIVDLNPIEMTILELREVISGLISNFTEFNDRTLLKELDILLNKLMTLKIGHHSIHKRGLINFLGTITKWISGTMDDEDRQIINQHLDLVDTNNGNIALTINKQIQINNNLNDTVYKLKNTILDDRQIIKNFVMNRENQTLTKLIIFDIKLKIQEIDRIINDLQDNIIFSNLNIIHPSLLSYKEIIDYDIDANKLKSLRVGFSKTNTDKLIFLIKIPYKMRKINKKLIIPLANEKDCKVINDKITETFEINNQYYEYNNNKALYQLNELKHCTLRRDCETIKNCNMEIIKINDNSILIQLANNLSLTSSYDERKFILNGNYFITFYNCSINLDNKIFSNNINEIKNNYIIQNLEYKPSNSTLTFKEIILETNKNINEIKLLKYHKILEYSGISIIVIIITVILIMLMTYKYCKRKNIKVKVINRIQENPNSNEGRVTCTEKPCHVNKNAHDAILF